MLSLQIVLRVGVCKVCSIDELAESIQVAKQYSRNGEIIIEEYIQGRYFSVDAFAYNGKITNLDIGYVRDFNSVDQFILKETINVNVLDATCDPIAKKYWIQINFYLKNFNIRWELRMLNMLWMRQIRFI